MKHLVTDAFALAVAALLAPLILLLLLFVLGISLLVGVVLLANPRMQPKDGTTRAESLREIAAVTLVVIAASAPLRALTVGIYGHLPPVLRGLDFWIQPLIHWWGPQSVAIVDGWWALIGMAALAAFAVLDGAWQLLQARQIRLLPTSRARSVAVGLVELSGVARPIERDHRDDQPILEWRYESGDDSLTIERVLQPFWLDDGTGRVVIDPRGARFDDRARHEGTHLGGRLGGFGLRNCRVLLTREHGRTRQGLRKQSLMPGDPVYVIGTAMHRAAVGAEGIPMEAEMVVAPRKGTLGFRFHDVFLLSDADEATTEGMVRSGVAFSLVWSLLGLVLCAWLWTIAEAARVDPLDAYGYPPLPASAEYKATRDMPLSMRRVDILDSAGDTWRHERSVTWMLEGLRSRPWADAQRYLPYLHALGARPAAEQVLREIAGSTADPERAANARAALEHWPDGGPDFEW